MMGARLCKGYDMKLDGRRHACVAMEASHHSLYLAVSFTCCCIARERASDRQPKRWPMAMLLVNASNYCHDVVKTVDALTATSATYGLPRRSASPHARGEEEGPICIWHWEETHNAQQFTVTL